MLRDQAGREISDDDPDKRAAENIGRIMDAGHDSGDTHHDTANKERRSPAFVVIKYYH